MVDQIKALNRMGYRVTFTRARDGAESVCHVELDMEAPRDVEWDGDPESALAHAHEGVMARMSRGRRDAR